MNATHTKQMYRHYISNTSDTTNITSIGMCIRYTTSTLHAYCSSSILLLYYYMYTHIQSLQAVLLSAHRRHGRAGY